MTSVTRFLKQVPQGQTYLSTGTLSALDNYAYELVPASGNVVGNYTPGSMVLAASVGTGLPTAIAAALTYAQAQPGGALAGDFVGVLRDMGKTVFANTATSVANAQTQSSSNSANYGYFRQVQLLVPTAVTANQIGGASGSVFGVVGPSVDAYSPYLTFYIPVAVAGVLLQVGGGNLLLNSIVAGGQM